MTETAERTAFILRRDLVPTRKTVEAYLPRRYAVTAETRKLIVIRGTDYAGWTLDDYVIPRLWSGLIAAREVKAGTGQGDGSWRQAATGQEDGQHLAAWISDNPALAGFIICDDGPGNPGGQYYVGTLDRGLTGTGTVEELAGRVLSHAASSVRVDTAGSLADAMAAVACHASEFGRALGTARLGEDRQDQAAGTRASRQKHAPRTRRPGPPHQNAPGPAAP